MTGMPWPLKPAAMNLVVGGFAVEVRNVRDGGLYEWEVEREHTVGGPDGDVTDGVEDDWIGVLTVLGMVGMMPTWGRESDV